MKIIFILIFYSFSSFALTENEIAHLVLKNFPLIEEAELKNKSASGEVSSAEGAFDYKLSMKTRNRIEEKYDNQYFETMLEKQTTLGGTMLIVGHRQGVGQFPSYDGKFKTSGAGELFAGLSLPILRNFKTDEFRTNFNIKQLEKKQAEYELELKKMIYVHKALSLYYKTILESQKLKIYKNIFELANKRQEMIEKKVVAGDIERIKLTDSLRTLNKRSDEVLKSEIELNKIKAELGIYLRDQDGKIIDIPSEFNTDFMLNKNDLLSFSSDIINNPQLKLLELEKEKLELETKFYDQSKLPGLNLELLGAKEMSENAPYDPESLQIGLKFDLPLENRKAEGKYISYKYKTLALEKKKEFLKNELKQQINFFTKASFDSKNRWEITSKEYEDTVKMAEAEKKKWAQGASDLFIVNLREENVADVEIRKWTSIYDYHQYSLDAKLFAGKILDNI